MGKYHTISGIIYMIGWFVFLDGAIVGGEVGQLPLPLPKRREEVFGALVAALVHLELRGAARHPGRRSSGGATARAASGCRRPRDTGRAGGGGSGSGCRH